SELILLADFLLNHSRIHRTAREFLLRISSTVRRPYRRLDLKRPVRVALIVVAFFGVRTPLASAAPITFRFSGSVDLTNFGGTPSNTFSGTVTWDTAASPVSTMGSTTTVYGATSATFLLNSINLTSQISNASFSITNGASDAFSFGWQLTPAYDAGA